MDERPLFLTDRMEGASEMTAIVFDTFSGQWLLFTDPLHVYVADQHKSVACILTTVEQHVNAGYYAVGFLAYEAAPAFDSALHVQPNPDFPLGLFAVFQNYTMIHLNDLNSGEFKLEAIRRSISENDFAANIQKIKKYITHGDTYQVNYTHRLRAEFHGDPLGLFTAMQKNQPTGYAAYLDWRDYAICSASPELFFKVDGRRIVTRPMKGTRPRGRFFQEDENLKNELAHSPKDRAENVMIVDMIRNDLGRIADSGSVHVDKLYEIEKYPTVWQMTSSISAETLADLNRLLTALFPCASITGAPKVRTMQIIKELETTPRQLYTGSIGLLKPDRKMQFNVAIRTAIVDKRKKRVEYGVGSGIVWDSEAESEWLECQSKSAILRQSMDFALLETMLYEPGRGIFLLQYHLERLQRSAQYFDFKCAMESITHRLHHLDEPHVRQKLRLLLYKNGHIELQQFAQPDSGAKNPLYLKLAAHPVDSTNVFLFHKTTCRDVYDAARNEQPCADDVILFNEKDQLTETTIHNIVLQFGENNYTPPVACGLLAGAYRAWLLHRGDVEEKILTLDDLQQCDEIFVINSVQAKRRAILFSD